VIRKAVNSSACAHPTNMRYEQSIVIVIIIIINIIQQVL